MTDSLHDVNGFGSGRDEQRRERSVGHDDAFRSAFGDKLDYRVKHFRIRGRRALEGARDIWLNEDRLVFLDEPQAAGQLHGALDGFFHIRAAANADVGRGRSLWSRVAPEGDAKRRANSQSHSRHPGCLEEMPPCHAARMEMHE